MKNTWKNVAGMATQQLAPIMKFAMRAISACLLVSVCCCASDVLYVADAKAQAIHVYPVGVNDPRPIKQITQGIGYPGFLATDAMGDLYVPDEIANTVTVFSIADFYDPDWKPSQVITDGVYSPRSVVVDASNTLYVANGANSTVTEYAFGASQVTATISAPPVSWCNAGLGYYCLPLGMTTDSEALYVNWLVINHAIVNTLIYRYPLGSTEGSDLDIGLLVSWSTALLDDGRLALSGAGFARKGQPNAVGILEYSLLDTAHYQRFPLKVFEQGIDFTQIAYRKLLYGVHPLPGFVDILDDKGLLRGVVSQGISQASGIAIGRDDGTP